MYKFLVTAKDLNDALNQLVQAIEEFIETGILHVELETDLNN